MSQTEPEDLTIDGTSLLAELRATAPGSATEPHPNRTEELPMTPKASGGGDRWRPRPNCSTTNLVGLETGLTRLGVIRASLIAVAVLLGLSLAAVSLLLVSADEQAPITTEPLEGE